MGNAYQIQSKGYFFMSIVLYIHTSKSFAHYYCILRGNLQSGVVASNYSKHDLLVGVLLAQLLQEK